MSNIITTRIELTGPLFSKDIRKTLQGNMTELLADLAREVEGSIVQRLKATERGRAPIHAISVGARTSHFVQGRVASMSGKPWRLHAIVSPNRYGLSKKQAIALYAAASRIEGRMHIFRRHARVVRRAAWNLTKGL